MMVGESFFCPILAYVSHGAPIQIDLNELCSDVASLALEHLVFDQPVAVTMLDNLPSLEASQLLEAITSTHRKVDNGWS